MRRGREQRCSGIHEDQLETNCYTSTLNVVAICGRSWWLFALELHMHVVLDLENLKEKLPWGLQQEQPPANRASQKSRVSVNCSRAWSPRPAPECKGCCVTCLTKLR